MNKLLAVLAAVAFGFGSVSVLAADAMKKDAMKPEVKAEEKPKEERGFFGRMLEKIGL